MSNKNCWKARRLRRSQNKKKNKGQQPQRAKREKPLNAITKEKSIPKKGDSERNKSQGGLVLAENHNETLDAMLQAYKARLKSLETLEERWRLYPAPQIEEKCSNTKKPQNQDFGVGVHLATKPFLRHHHSIGSTVMHLHLNLHLI